MEDSRADKLLWALRVFKTRGLAAEACEEGRVAIGDFGIKPGRKVHVGEVVVVRLEELTRTLRIEGIPRTRVGAREAARLMTDLTPPEEYERAKQAAIAASLAGRKGLGRPTKKERRDIGKFLGWD